ncbi:MAG: hypothetical protein F6K17_09890 [Okeania sp. SIO3C4]|nr:hypothetical protein [Okeania sp. SIO3C4]
MFFLRLVDEAIASYILQDLRRITISSRGVNDSYAQAFGRSPLQMVYNLTFCVSPVLYRIRLYSIC